MATYQQQTNVTYPLCIDAATTRSLYNAFEANDVSIVIDQNGIVRYRGAGVDVSSITDWIDQLLITSIGETEHTPFTFELLQNYPNPFNPVTKIDFEIPKSGNVSLQIFDIQGRLVVELVNSNLHSGRHSISWNGLDAARKPVVSGVYIYRLTSDALVEIKKMTLLR